MTQPVCVCVALRLLVKVVKKNLITLAMLRGDSTLGCTLVFRQPLDWGVLRSVAVRNHFTPGVESHCTATSKEK